MMPPFDTALLNRVECEHPTIVQAKTELARALVLRRRLRLRAFAVALRKKLIWRHRELPNVQSAERVSV